MSVVPERLKELRESQGLSFRQLADKTDGAVSYSYIGEIEKGKHPRVSTVVTQALADALGVPLQELTGVSTTAAHKRAKSVEDRLLESFRRLSGVDKEEVVELTEGKVARRRRGRVERGKR